MNATAPGYVGYGRSFAPIYDQIFPRETITEAEIAWLIRQIPTGSSRLLELGVGTGRVAIPLARALFEGAEAIGYRGIDISSEMLAALAAADGEKIVAAELGDILTHDYGNGLDSILCVCGTISMLAAPQQQAEIFRKAAAALKPGGTLIVETHNSELVASLHQDGTATYAIPYPGARRALVTFSELAGTAWHLEHCWIDGKDTRFLSEDSRVTTLAELDQYAADCRLTLLSHTAGLNGAPIEAISGTVTAVYRKDETAA
ncbi:class I SAM-dependent methyltransferase [Leifsonia virtsii]|uniref:Class I SAM-dependent methyltransferase n=1 Tax=Leifsonia virtsii TaxID=3035915 RepID=A0ABT8IYE9_9MICO|nr:class I SAM-dependent methyltransferase [Leifsonia virtsii]MDN4597852.1 class I SAM-dependent methyltransferase [Leifsonia virtsii]